MGEHVKLLEKYGLFIDGEFCDSSDGGTFESFCPANGEKLAVCSEATKEDVDRAVKGAWTVAQDRRNPGREQGTPGHGRIHGQRKTNP